MRRDYSQREIFGKPSELNNAELARAEEYASKEVERYPRGWAIIDRLNKIIAEREKRERQTGLISAVDQFRDESSRLADALDDAGITLEELLEELKQRRRR